MRLVSSDAPGSRPSLFPVPALLIAVAAFAVVVPMLFRGIPSGHDFEFHLDSWMEVLRQWKLGILYPRWASLAHYGYGEARFVFYPPLSWGLGALLGAILPWKTVPGAFTWIALTAAGWSMFFLARRFFSPREAIFAAVVYAANPYNLVIVYWRSADAELLAGIFIPLLLLFLLDSAEAGAKWVIPLALVMASVWLTNGPSAVMANYSLALLAILVAFAKKSPRLLLYAGAAAALGAALAAFYLFPAVYEERWVNIAQVLSPGVRPQDNFLFTVINDPEHNRFNLIVSIVAAGEMVILVAAGLLLLLRGRRAWLSWTNFAWAAVVSLLMFPFTHWLWEYLPKLRFVQLPWRWLLCLNVALTLLIMLEWKKWTSRLLICVAMLVPVLIGWNKVQPPWWDHADDIAEIQNNIQEGSGYEGTDEYVPTGADPYEIQSNAPKALLPNDPKGTVRVIQWAPESKTVEAQTAQRAQLVLKLFNYPAWQAVKNGQAVRAGTHEVTGQMVIPLDPGRNVIQLTFTRTWDRTLGGIVSLISFVIVAALLFGQRMRARKNC